MVGHAYPNPNGDEDAPLGPFHVLPYRLLSKEYASYRRDDQVSEHDVGELVGGTMEELAAAAEALVRGVIASWGHVDGSRGVRVEYQRLAWLGEALAKHPRHRSDDVFDVVRRPPGDKLRYVEFGRHRIELRDPEGRPADLDEEDPAWAGLRQVQDGALAEVRTAVKDGGVTAKAREEEQDRARKREEIAELKAELGE